MSGLFGALPFYLLDPVLHAALFYIGVRFTLRVHESVSIVVTNDAQAVR